MGLYLPPAPKEYDPLDQTNIRRELQQADDANRKQNADVDILSSRLILQSPDGTRWSVTVDNSGALSTTLL